jgi:hypothetical protein
MTPEEYTQAIRRLAVDTAMPNDAAARMERDLERAFAAGSKDLPAGSKDPVLHGGSWAAVAAAVLVLGAAIWLWRGPVTQNNVTSPVPSKTPATDSSRTAVVSGVTPHATAVVPGPQRGTVIPKTAPAIVRPSGFVPVPAAAGLPQFESGMIVRLSLPVTALPAYGVDISPAFTEASVEADVLVAQDGFARAIRLVNTSRSQQ